MKERNPEESRLIRFPESPMHDQINVLSNQLRFHDMALDALEQTRAQLLAELMRVDGRIFGIRVSRDQTQRSLAALKERTQQ